MKLEIKFNPEDVAKVKLMLSEIEASRCLRNALNDTITGIQTDAARAVYADLNLTQTRIRQGFRIQRATIDDLWGSFRSIGKPVNLATFTGSRMTTRGLSVKVKRNGTRTTLKHGFLWTRPTKQGDEARTAFQRAYTGARTRASNQLPWRKMPGHYRLPLETLTGPRIEDILGREDILSSLSALAGERLEKNTERELDWILSKH
jgi:hypothetical protein